PLANRKFWVDFYATDQPGAIGPDGRHYGEGRTFLGSWLVTTDGNGDAACTAVLPTNLPAYPTVYLTATATYADAPYYVNPADTRTYATFGDTSEFSASLTVSAANVAPLTAADLQAMVNSVAAVATQKRVFDVVPVAAGSKVVVLYAATDAQLHNLVTAVNG